ncbi:hypothetical protein [Spirillospora sp. CA-294931]|uniref:hypothetical protein n=1 Tax=Spirillospora sp. CA-294931 TaxID=3240042 RepID=UPI003D93FE7E
MACLIVVIAVSLVAGLVGPVPASAYPKPREDKRPKTQQERSVKTRKVPVKGH